MSFAARASNNEGGRTPFFFSGLWIPLSLSQPPSLVSAFQSIHGTPQLLPTPPSAARRKWTRADAGKPRMPAKVALWSAWQGTRPLTLRLPATSSLPRAPVDAPRRPLHASRPPTCSRALLSLLQLTPERCPTRPMLASLLWPARSSFRSSSLSLAP